MQIRQPTLTLKPEETPQIQNSCIRGPNFIESLNLY